MKPRNEYVLSVKMNNKFGVLTRVLTQIRREGCNIKSLNVAETLDNTVSTMNINVESYNYLFEDILSRLRNLSCVLQVDVCHDKESFISKEYALIHIKEDITEEIQKVIDEYSIENQRCTGIYDIRCTTHTLDEISKKLNSICDVEIVRSGVINIFTK